MTITEQMLLADQELRKKLIKSFDAAASRKHEAFKAYECLKDKTENYVLDLLLKMFDVETVGEMQHAISNISIFRKVIDKLAKVYANGVKRTMPESEAEKKAREKKLLETQAANALPPPAPVEADNGTSPNPVPGRAPAPGEESPPGTPPAVPEPVEKTKAQIETEALEKLAELLDMNAAMKKANRYYRAFLNTLIYVRPMPVDDRWTLKVEVKPPFSYDVVEDEANPAIPIAVICSDYIPTRQTLYAFGDPARVGRTVGVVRDMPTPAMTNLSAASEEDPREFIWWTRNYHFTTNAKGEITSQGSPVNPIRELPFVNIAGEQDLSFWAEGGKDLVDTGIKINVDITNLKHISVNQGYGQMYMTGKNLPKSVKVGPNHCIQLTQEEGEPAPTVGFLNANPPLDALKNAIEMTTALMLTTNNLSTSGFSTSLQGGAAFASGVALMIDKSESNDDITEQAQIFVKKEPQVWKKIGLWLEVYRTKGLLIEELQSIAVPKKLESVQLKFPPAKPIMSESEHLDVLEKRKKSGFNTEVELIMRDDPSLSETEALEKLEKIKAEKKANAAAFGPPPGEMNGDQGKESDGKPGSNGDQSGNHPGVA